MTDSNIPQEYWLKLVHDEGVVFQKCFHDLALARASAELMQVVLDNTDDDSHAIRIDDMPAEDEP